MADNEKNDNGKKYWVDSPIIGGYRYRPGDPVDESRPEVAAFVGTHPGSYRTATGEVEEVPSPRRRKAAASGDGATRKRKTKTGAPARRPRPAGAPPKDGEL